MDGWVDGGVFTVFCSAVDVDPGLPTSDPFTPLSRSSHDLDLTRTDLV